MPSLDLGRVVGATGATPNITANASVDANTGTPSVNVTQSGTAENPIINFEFHNLKGEGGGGSSVEPYTSAPEMDGTADAGSSDDYARGDHVHPSDTSRVAKAGDTMTGALTVQGNITSTAEIEDGGNNVLSDKFDATSLVFQNYRITVPASGWSSTASGGYYTQTITLPYPINSYKEIDINPTGANDSTEQTSAEAVAYACLKHFKVADGTGVTSATLYASTKPTTTFYAMVSGYYMARNAASSGVALDIKTANKLNFYDANGTLVAGFDGSAVHNIYRRSNVVTVSSSGWSNNPNASGYYTNTASLGANYNGYDTPDISPCGSSGGQASAEEGAAYNLIDRASVADAISTDTITFYAKTKPTTTTYVRVRGTYIE